MALVTLSVNGRRYEVTCDDGEEERLRELGASLDRRVHNLVASLGQVGEARLLLLTCLLLEDEIAEARAIGQRIGVTPDNRTDAFNDGAQVGIEALGSDDHALDAIIGRIEAVAGRLKPS